MMPFPGSSGVAGRPFWGMSSGGGGDLGGYGGGSQPRQGVELQKRRTSVEQTGHALTRQQLPALFKALRF